MRMMKEKSGSISMPCRKLDKELTWENCGAPSAEDYFDQYLVPLYTPVHRIL